MIVRLDYQNHSAALPAAGRPQPWSPSTAASCSPSSQLCSPRKGPVGPIAQHCFIEGSGSVPGPYKHQPLDHLGLAITMFSPCCPRYIHPSAIFWEEETKGSRSGDEGRFQPLSIPLSPCPLLQPRQTLLIPEKTIER